MKINVVNVGNPWKATPTSDPMYMIHIEGNGEPQKTYDAKLAELGEHEAESFTSKSGKTYWRTPKPQRQFGGGSKQFKADPDSRESIEWQTSLKAAVDVTRDYLMMAGNTPSSIKDYCKYVDKAAVHFKNLINIKPSSVTQDEQEDVIEDKGDFAMFVQDTTSVDDLPPVELYEQS